MTAILAFALTLLLAVLISDLANRSVLSTAVLFLLAGVAAGVSRFVDLTPDSKVVASFAELALFSVLFTDGMRLGARELLKAWHLPGRALLLGLPLTLLGTALLARLVVGLPWDESFLIGAILSPTDPVFASAIVGREEIPLRLRQLLSIESGFNDGLSLPLVVILLAYAGAPQEANIPHLLGEVAFGVMIGVAIPAVVIPLERTRFFGAHKLYEPLIGFAIGLLVLSLTAMLEVNEFLAAFSAGITVATVGPRVRDAFQTLGEQLTELLKLSALLVFGAMISPRFLMEIPVSGYVFALLVLLIVRPAALSIALCRSDLTRREWITVAWFGPKGFASVFFGLLIIHAGVPRADELFHLIALVIAGSIIAHASTDVLIARWFLDRDEDGNDQDEGKAREAGGRREAAIAATTDGPSGG